jgi:hypothetical protein
MTTQKTTLADLPGLKAAELKIRIAAYRAECTRMLKVFNRLTNFAEVRYRKESHPFTILIDQANQVQITCEFMASEIMSMEMQLQDIIGR